jgi:hypothetical protein
MNQSVTKVLKNKMPFFARKRRFAWSKTGFFAQKGPEMAEVIAGNQARFAGLYKWVMVGTRSKFPGWKQKKKMRRLQC